VRPFAAAGLERLAVGDDVSLRIGPIEAIDGTPVIDVKPVLAGARDF
jgi:tRNA (Thr-GGU) A37 N-methylase